MKKKRKKGKEIGKRGACWAQSPGRPMFPSTAQPTEPHSPAPAHRRVVPTWQPLFPAPTSDQVCATPWDLRLTTWARWSLSRRLLFLPSAAESGWRGCFAAKFAAVGRPGRHPELDTNEAVYSSSLSTSPLSSRLLSLASAACTATFHTKSVRRRGRILN